MSFELNSSTVLAIIMISFALFRAPVVGTEEKEPNFCGQTELDSAYSDHKKNILFTQKQWVWTVPEDKEVMSSPSLLSAKETFKIQSVVYISAIPQCSQCGDVSKAKDLMIMFYKMKGKTFVGNYQVKRVFNGELQLMDDSPSLPSGLKPRGNLFASDETFWPKELLKNASDLDKKHTILVYNPTTYEVIILTNGVSKGYLCYNGFSEQKQWTEGWKCRSTGNDYTFIGAYVKKKSVYVLGVKGSDNRLFTVTDGEHELMDTNLDVQHYFTCGAASRGAAGRESGDGKSGGGRGLGFWIIIAIIGLVVIIAIVGLISFFATRNDTKADNKSKTGSGKAKGGANADRNKTSRILDKKGQEVGEDKIGALDSKVDWDIIVAQPSIGDFTGDSKDNKKGMSPKKPVSKKK